jgi:TIR domain
LSYTHASEQHQEWVKELATFLRENGINARLDAWHLHLGADLAQWMTNELDPARRVLLICNEEYAQRADRRHGGVGWEIRIVQGDMLSAPPDEANTWAVVRTEKFEEGLPKFLRSSFCLHWPPSTDNEPKREELLKALYEHNNEPPLGSPPVWFRLPGAAAAG